MGSFDFDEVLGYAKGKMKAVEAAEMYLEYLVNDWGGVIPHCDFRVLHSPGTCKLCDKEPALQQYREMLGLKYTDELHVNDPLLPGQDRTRASAEAWGGNR